MNLKAMIIFAVAASVVAVILGGYALYLGKVLEVETKVVSIRVGDDKQIFVGLQGGPGAVRENTDQTVWESKCPTNSKPISGSCIILKGRGALQNVGIDAAQNSWTCVYEVPMEEVFVDAICVTGE